MGPKAALVNPHFPVRTYPGAPMGLFTIGGSLKRTGAEVSYFDSDPMGGLKEFKRFLEKEKPAILGLTSLSFQINEAAELARIAKDADPNITVILGGRHATVGWKEVLEDYNCFDACCVGEGEELIVEACSGARFEKIKGLAHRVGDSVVYNGPRPVQKNIDLYTSDRSLHFPSYDFEILFHKDGTPLKTAQVMASRGCPYQCVFCTESIMSDMANEARGPGFRRSSLESIRREMRGLKENGYEFVYFDDSTFTLNKRYALEISKIMSEFGLLWGCNTRVDSIDYKLASEMAKNGCTYMFCGFESAVPEVLLAMKKTNKPEYYLKCAQEVYGWLGELGFDRMAYIIFGGPKLKPDGSIGVENFDDAKRSIDFVVEKLKPNEISPSGFRLLPGTTAATDIRYAALWPGGKPISSRDYHTKERLTTHPIMDGLEGRGSVNSAVLDPESAYRIVEYLVAIENSGGPRINFTKGFEDKHIIKGNWFKKLMPLAAMRAG